MRLSFYLTLLVSMSIIFYMLGFQPIVNLVDDTPTVVEIGGVSKIQALNSTTNNYELEQTLKQSDTVVGSISLVLVAIVGLLALVTGFSAIYIVPLVIILAILNFFVFPFSFIMAGSLLPTEISYILIAFYNLLTILAVLSFTRGSV